MTAEREEPRLYWDGGIFQCGIYSETPVPQEWMESAIESLQQFLLECQKHYFAFASAVLGIARWNEQSQQMLSQANPDNTLFMGTGNPNEPQTPGRSTIGRMNIGEYLENLQPGGVFEDYQAKALVVVVHHIWDERYRTMIADAVNVAHNQVECDLMGDIRLVRNLLIHNKSVVPEGFKRRIGFLPQIWSMDPGELRITRPMIDSLFEQIQAIKLRIVPPKS